MLASITPLGERGRGASWRRTTTAYVVASVVGGAVVGAALGTVGGLLDAPRPPWLLIVVAVAAFAAIVLDVRGPLPAIRRQVDETWMTRYRDWVYGAGFGLQLGIAALTIVTSAATYLTWLLELLTGSALAGVAVGTMFGLARALPLLTMRGVDDPAKLRAAHRDWQARYDVVRRLTFAIEAAAGVALLAVAA